MAQNELINMREVKRRANQVIEAMASDVAMQIEGAYERAIDEFYAEYEPAWYNRTYSTYLASSGYRDLFGDWKDGDKYTAGIIVDPNNIGFDPYRADTDWVFNRTFEKGIHGISIRDKNAKKHNTNKSWKDLGKYRYRYKKMLRKYKSQVSVNIYGGALLQAAREYSPYISMTGRYVQSSSLNRYDNGSKRQRGMTPKQAMDFDFNKIKTKKRMKEVEEKYMKQYFPEFF